jgi:methionine aminotransferase
MLKIASKLPHLGTTIFTVMSQMASEYKAINLSQGYPDFDVPEPLLALMTKYLNAGMNQYPPMTGVPYLRQQIAVKVENLYDCKVDSETEITVTSGATEALFVAIQATIKADDDVIVFDPVYDSYEPAIQLAGGRAIHVPLDDQFNINWDLVRAAMTSRTRMIIVNSPHNPSGSTLKSDDLDQLQALTEDTNIIVLSDEVYEHMVFNGLPHESILTRPKLKQRAFVVSSFGKTYHATGWKVAYCIAPEALSKEFRKVHQYVTFTTHTPTQWALAEYMESHPEHYLELPQFYQAKRDLFLEEMKDSRFKLSPSQGTYFQLADYGEISDKSDVEFANWLTQEMGVAAIPISVFYEKPVSGRHVRFCFAKDDSTIKAACKILREL